jgi:putative radical SAM enzyme (TIGR03279 family)
VSAPRISQIAPGSPAEAAGLLVGDEVLSINEAEPLDVIEWQQMTDGDELVLLVRREQSAIDRKFRVSKAEGEPLGARVDSAVFDRIRTCDNHCEFCFIYQLPKGMRKSLYLKDDDYRLSFLYGNFTTLTRFTEIDAERVITERLSPLYVSVHASDPDVRAGLLRNARGATSLRWLDVLLENGIEVHAQVVVCPSVNDGDVLDDTLMAFLDRFAAVASVGVVPLGISDHSNEANMRPHTPSEANAALESVERAAELSLRLLGRRRIFASDEFYLIAQRQLPALSSLEDLTQIENGIGMIRSFEESFRTRHRSHAGAHGTGFFQWVDGAPPWGYRAERGPVSEAATTGRPPVVLTGAYGARIIPGLLQEVGLDGVEVLNVENRFFGGNIAVAGLMTGEDVSRTIVEHGSGGTYLLPDVCLHEGLLIDGMKVDDLPGHVEVVPTDGAALRDHLERSLGLATVSA